MQVAVFDTYVIKKNGKLMHFDIIVPTGTEDASVFDYGKIYLENKGQQGQEISSKECQFCHIEQLQPHMETDIKNDGYHILEMQGC